MKLAAACVIAVTAAAHAGEVLDTEVAYADGRYTVRFDVRLDAAPERLKHYLTDYEHYHDYFAAVHESHVLARADDGLRVRLSLDSCVLFFCQDVVFVKDITEQADGQIMAHIVPAESDFREATEYWRIVPDDGHTRLSYRADLVPDFFVPPLIGPWLLKRKIRDALESGAARLEMLAQTPE